MRVNHRQKGRKKRLSKSFAFGISRSKPPIENYLSEIYDKWRFNQFERGSPNQKVYRVREQKITQLFDKFGNQDIEVRIDAVDEEGYLTIRFLANGAGCKQKMERQKTIFLQNEKEEDNRKEKERQKKRQEMIANEMERFGYLKELAKKHKCGSLYIIELDDRFKSIIIKSKILRNNELVSRAKIRVSMHE